MTDIQKKSWLRIFTDLVGLFDSKPRAAVTVLMIFIIGLLFYDNRRLSQLRIDDTVKWQAREAALYDKIINRYDPKFNQIKATTDSTKATVDSSTSAIKPVLNKIKQKLNDM